jgi:hypothetical protein
VPLAVVKPEFAEYGTWVGASMRALLYCTSPSFAYCFQPVPTLVCEFLNSKAVFVGTVIAVRAAPPQGAAGVDGWLYELTVQELFRGPRRKAFEVFTENSSGSFPLDVAKKYLLFADEENGRLTITNCGNSSLESDAQEVIRDLRRLEIPKDAAIEGRISFSGIPDSGAHLPGIEIIIRGNGKTFKATSDRDGWFPGEIFSGGPADSSLGHRSIPQQLRQSEPLRCAQTALFWAAICRDSKVAVTEF